jgi:4-oxalocrotonate tautomerase family enzyme
MPTVIVNWLEGRDDDMKRRVAKGFTEVLGKEVGAPPENCTVMFNDLPNTNIAKAGVLFSDRKK